MLIFVLPIYNEEGVIEKLIREIAEFPSEHKIHIIAVDDGSSDRSLEIVSNLSKEVPISIIKHIKNKGLGETIKDGLLKASEISKNEDIIITLDADNTHPVSLVTEMLEKIKEGNELVIASRYIKGGKEIGLSFKRHILSLGINLILKTLFPIKGIKEYSCGFRAYNALLLKRGFDEYEGKLVEEKGFLCMAEILIKLRKVLKKASEVPLVLRYDFKVGKSKMNVSKTVKEYVGLILKYKILTKLLK